MALVPFLHTVAMIPFFVNGEEFTIYNSQFNYQFDFITHVAGFVIASLIALQIIYSKNKKVKVKQGLPFVPAFLIAFILYLFRDYVISLFFPIA